MNKILLVTLLITIIIIGSLVYYLSATKVQEQSNIPENDCQPTFVDGGGPYYIPNSPMRERIAPEDAEGTPLSVSGKVLLSDCKTPLGNAILDIWQANESGEYEDEWYRGRVATNNDGSYSFTTVVPSGYGEGIGFRPPHIHFKVWNGNNELITSQMFFPESKGRPGFEDAYIMKVDMEKGEAVHNIILP